MKTPALAEFKRFSRDIAPAARAVLMAQAFAETERERVNKYILPIFQRYGFVYGEIAGEEKRGLPLEKPDHLYLCTDEERVKTYFDECDRAHRAHGFTGPVGHCPALRAENLLMQTERALLELGGEFFGVDFADTYGENRKKALKLLIGAALKAEKEAA